MVLFYWPLVADLRASFVCRTRRERTTRTLFKNRFEPHLLSTRGSLESKAREATEPAKRAAAQQDSVGLWLSFLTSLRAGSPTGGFRNFLIPRGEPAATSQRRKRLASYSSPHRLAAELPLARPDPIDGLGWVQISAKMMLKKPLDGLERTSKIACFPHD